jgi:hypothetical protein
MLYDFVNSLDMNDIFWLKGSYYVTDDTSIYAAGTAITDVSFNTIVSRILGMKFLAADSGMALFVSPADGMIYSFTGDYEVHPFLDCSQINVSDAVYSPALGMFAFLADNEVILARSNTASLHIGGSSIATTRSQIIVEDGPHSTAISFKNGTHLANDMSSNFLYIKDGIVSSFTEMIMRLKKLDSPVVNYQLSVDLLLTDGIKHKEIKGTTTFKEGMDTAIIKLSGLGTARALSYSFRTDAACQIQGISLDATPVAKTAVISRGGSNALSN